AQGNSQLHLAIDQLTRARSADRCVAGRSTFAQGIATCVQRAYAVVGNGRGQGRPSWAVDQTEGPVTGLGRAPIHRFDKGDLAGLPGADGGTGTTLFSDIQNELAIVQCTHTAGSSQGVLARS